VLDVAVQAGVVERSGSFFAFGEERLGQGRAKAKAFLEERPELVEAIGAAVVRSASGEGGGELALAA
jgi:recombination protein RecA